MVDSDMVINYELVEEAKSCSNCRYRYCYIGANKPMCINQSVVTAAKNYKFNSKSLCNEEEDNRIFDAINLYNVVFKTTSSIVNPYATRKRIIGYLMQLIYIMLSL